jgi:malate dehydrogenase (oxaloacetate-decarboxylating)(NADP+)
VREAPRRVVFAEGEENRVVRAANAYLNSGLGEPVLIGRETAILDAFRASGITYRNGIEIHNARLSHQNKEYAEFLYSRLQRKGYLFRDCQRMVNTDRNIFAACMVACGHADAMVTGTTRNWTTAYQNVREVLDPKPNRTVIGVSLVISRGRSVLVADTSVHDMPNAEQLANIACEAAKVGKRLGFEPRVAMLAYSTFGHPKGERSERVQEAVKILDNRGVDFEYDGEMAADVALNRKAMALYPFCRLSDTANILVMPAFHSASISTKMLQELGGGTVIGPLLVGLSKPVQIATLGATDSDLVNMAALAAYDISG